MAVDATKVLVGAPDQASGTGAIFSAPLGTAAPTDARTTLNVAFTAGGYVGEDGVTISPDYNTTDITDWSGATVRTLLESFNGVVKYAHLQVDGYAAADTFGAANVTTTAATSTKGTQMTIKMGANLPAAVSRVFKMKDGNNLIRIYLPNSQVTKVDDISFKAKEAISLSVEVSCYPDATGTSIYIFTDDGVFSA